MADNWISVPSDNLLEKEEISIEVSFACWLVGLLPPPLQPQPVRPTSAINSAISEIELRMLRKKRLNMKTPVFASNSTKIIPVESDV